MDKLTPRLKDVLELLSQGKSNKEIGNELGITDTTVKCHLRKAFKIFNVKSRFELAIKYIKSTRSDSLLHLDITRQNLADAEEREEMLLKAFQFALNLSDIGTKKETIIKHLERWDGATASHIKDFCEVS